MHLTLICRPAKVSSNRLVVIGTRLEPASFSQFPGRYSTIRPVHPLLLGGELLAERCRTDDLMPSIPVLCLPPSRVDPKVLLNNCINRRMKIKRAFVTFPQC